MCVKCHHIIACAARTGLSGTTLRLNWIFAEKEITFKRKLPENKKVLSLIGLCCHFTHALSPVFPDRGSNVIHIYIMFMFPVWGSRTQVEKNPREYNNYTNYIPSWDLYGNHLSFFEAPIII